VYLHRLLSGFQYRQSYFSLKEFQTHSLLTNTCIRRKQAFVSIVFLRSKLKAYLNVEVNQINDPLKKARDVKNIGHYSTGNIEITINDRNEIPYMLTLIKHFYCWSYVVPW
jgi:predicted transport protein